MASEDDRPNDSPRNKRRKTSGDSSPPYAPQRDALDNDRSPRQSRQLSIRDNRRNSRTVSPSPGDDCAGNKYYESRQPFKPNYRARLVLHGHTKPVSQVRISPNGKFIASASADATVKIWDATTGEHMDTLVGHMAGVSCLAWTPDSNTIASGSDDKAIRLWDRVTGRPKTTTRKSVAGQEMGPLKGHHNYIHCLAFSPKGNILASGSYDEAVFLWDVRAGRLMRSLPAHSDPVSGVDFSRDGTLVVSCSTDGLIRIWDTSTGQCLRTLVHEDNPAVANVCFSPNGRFVLAFNLDNCIRLWDYVSGTVKKTYQGHANEKFAVGGCFGVLEGAPFIASASEDGSIVMWDVVSKTVLQRVEGHKGVCFWVDVHGETMVTGGQDNTVKVYRHIRDNKVNGDTEKVDKEPHSEGSLAQQDVAMKGA
ncbi:hypothetical protein J7337_001121 [Fusarium musae]|uniref:Mitochondrial division protein 1 n=1 Tax=Fusarium musae TaxID=1042133 RepID=A0A9P8DT14_9HYPO|nr:hypothetical protein J7337_001121 [Fusarium musae]KAG9507568.1 hypothetical protein J7337_001121 [Fusarium musae]